MSRMFLFTLFLAVMVCDRTMATSQLFGTPCMESPRPCGVKPRKPLHGNVTSIDDGMGGVALEFTCEQGYLLKGKPVISCCEGYWKEPFPKCVTKDCKSHLNAGKTKDGTYIIYPDGKEMAVHCDMTTLGGGWTVIQRRQDNTTNFYRNWTDYKNGFGKYNENFWIGLENLYELTKWGSEIFAYMEADIGENAYAHYTEFMVNGEDDKYRASIGGYSGNASDSMGYINHFMFSTYDSNNDIHGTSCSERFKGGWWYGKCHDANPNGLYLNGPHPDIYAAGINWKTYKGYHYSLKYFELKVR